MSVIDFNVVDSGTRLFIEMHPCVLEVSGVPEARWCTLRVKQMQSFRVISSSVCVTATPTSSWRQIHPQ